MVRSTAEEKGKNPRKRKLCPHGKEKYRCKKCGGAGICEHGINKYSCKECDGAGICEHGIHKNYCKKCGGAELCEHGKHKYRCTDCGGRQLCKTPHCTTRKNRKYKEHCFFCFVHLFPPERVARDYRTKETTVVTFLQEKFPNVDWRWNKTIDDRCSKRRPDLLLDMESHILIIEVDENSHDMYDPTCEEKRMGEIWNDVGHRPIVFFRFNPDKYKDKDGNNVPSPWGGKRANGVVTLSKKWKSAPD